MKKITVIIPASKNSVINSEKILKEIKAKKIIERGDNPSKNRNRGIRKANTPYIAFINAHTILDDHWYKNVLKFFEDYPDFDVVGGPQKTYFSEGIFARASGYALSSSFGAANVKNRYKSSKINFDADETMITSANLICKKKVFKKVMFDENLYPGEDPKFIEDCKKERFKVAYSPEIATYNLRRKNIFALSKQIFSYGFTRPKKESLIKTMKRPFFLVPSLFFMYLIATLFVFLFGSLTLLVLLPLILYFVLDISFSLAESAINRDIFSFFLLIFIYPVIHLSYGAGFLASTIKHFKI